jgi:putative redox protein
MAHEPRSVVVAENGEGRYQQAVSAGAHRLLADEPVSMGGADAGPAPYDYLLTALGACTSMTLRMYAELKKLPLTRVSVALSHEKIEADGQKVDRITREITLEGELTPEQRQRMLEIANRCPIHRTLSGGVNIDSRLAD